MVDQVTAAPIADAATADLQLSFQERLHDVQRMLERATAARGMTVPEQLGFPKEMPPAETVPRLLVQLTMIKELTTLLLEQGVVSLNAFKLEDPDVVPEGQDARRPLLSRLPLRVRFTASLPQLMRILTAVQRTDRLLDLRTLQVMTGETPDRLQVELVLARYVLAPGAQKHDDS